MTSAADSTARVLRLLGLLQSRPVWTGTELAARLEVTTRCVRRDVERLRDLGYAVQAARGAGGGYHLSSGKPVPPLLLDDDEAVAVAVCLITGAGATSAVLDDAAMRALLKLDQTLPEPLRARVRAVQEATVTLDRGDTGIDPARLRVLTTAAANRQIIRFEYRTPTGVRSQRRVEPYRLVSAGQRWYLLAFDLDRDDWRTFRVDRIGAKPDGPQPSQTSQREPGPEGGPPGAVEVSTFRFRPRPTPDPQAYLRDAFTRGGFAHTMRVLVNRPAGELRDRFPPQRASVRAAEPPPDADGQSQWSELVVGVDDLDLGARYLTTLNAELRILEPPELLDAIQQLAESLRRATLVPEADYLNART